MPMAIIRVVEGVLDDDGKREVVERVTDALVETEGQGNEALRRTLRVRPAGWRRPGSTIPTCRTSRRSAPRASDSSGACRSHTRRRRGMTVRTRTVRARCGPTPSVSASTE